MLRKRNSLVGAVLFGAIATVQSSSAKADQLVPFAQFYQQVTTATLGSQAVKPGVKVTEPAAFTAMRDHVVTLYAGVTVKQSFLLDSHPYDCVPLAQQPSVRMLGLTSIASPPSMPTAPGTVQTAEAFAQLQPSEKTDTLGNSTVCQDGTIPMRRVTLDDIAHFKSLAEYFQKGPGGAGQITPGNGASSAAATTHKYAHSYQNVASFGGSSRNNLWSPYVNTSLGEIFSLSQFWYVNWNGPVQTIEMGFQNYPQKYGINKSVLFIYYTTDGYNSTGCYNLDCKAFVQTNKNVYLGKGFVNYSTDGGAQYAPQLAAYLYQGNWWLYLNGGTASNAIGYYPAALFKGVPLARATSEIDYGGEVVGSTVWPPMGSGQFAGRGFGHAAFDYQIQYFPTAGGTRSANLSVSQPSPACFTDITTDSASTSGWGTYFYFGGPGGRSC